VGRREDNKAQKRGALIEAGLRLFGAHGFERASIEQIAADAGTARGTFYLYFESKEALFEAIVDGFFEPLMAIFDEVGRSLDRAASPAEALVVYQVMAVRLAALGLGHRERVLLVFREMRGQGLPGLRARERALIDRITALTLQARELGLVRVEDPRLASLVILGGIERLYFEALIGELELGDAPGLAARAAVLLSRVLGIGVAGG
jgi:AcrR family transcriptional regulator